MIETLPTLKVHEKFTLALEQFLAMLADLDDPRNAMKVRSASLESNYRAPMSGDVLTATMRERCTNQPLAERFGLAMRTIDSEQGRAVRYHFDVSSYSQYSEAWDIVATNEARYFRMPVLDYIGLIQAGVEAVESKL